MGRLWNIHIVNPSHTLPSRTYNNPDYEPENATNGTGAGSIVTWNPRDAEKGCSVCPEANLLHELRHAFDRHTGKLDRTTNPDSGLPKSEEEAVRTENQYRADDDQRKTYNGKPVPNPSGTPGNPAPPVPQPPKP
jgi:hypothetical protein